MRLPNHCDNDHCDRTRLLLLLLMVHTLSVRAGRFSRHYQENVARIDATTSQRSTIAMKATMNQSLMDMGVSEIVRC